MRRVKNYLLAAVLLSFWLFSGSGAAETHGFGFATGGDLLAHARYLASDEMMGRGIDTPGLVKARNYIADEFQKYGLTPGGSDGAYIQGVEVVSGMRTRQPTALALGGKSLTLDNDWTPLGFSSSGAVEGEAVFVGYGITAKNYDDYAGMDVQGKIVVVLRYEPPPKDEKSPFQKSPRYSSHATFRAKANNARNHGARAMILVDLDPKRSGKNELITLARSRDRQSGEFIAAQIKRSALEEGLEKSGVSLNRLKEQIDREEKPASMPLPGLRVSVRVSLEKIVQTAHNVIGILPGSDPRLREETIVVGAHYDHLGLDGHGARDSSQNGQIYNGADDNASGTSVLLALAAGLGRLPERPPRTIIFAAFAGEELGLYGSRHFVEHPPVPLADVKAMINLDMVGRMKDNVVAVSGTGSAKEFEPLIGKAGQALGLTIRPSSKNGGNSDHAPFYQKNIPALHFHTGLHEDYHRPTDDWEKLNIDGMEKISNLVFTIVARLASAEKSPVFAPLAAHSSGPAS